ncbi:hypothetical protein ISN44_As09g026770 [Arabidopsis suecica]|uniref:Uncharacterized protein n=1 Tax=Arabidopsis suecica TaxID=45249 RepID=A0A8T2ALF0_ARASU|nr:hypothetical protein ISN44_As09g026770 [Arabidopsis suecica]
MESSRGSAVRRVTAAMAEVGGGQEGFAESSRWLAVDLCDLRRLLRRSGSDNVEPVSRRVRHPGRSVAGQEGRRREFSGGNRILLPLGFDPSLSRKAVDLESAGIGASDSLLPVINTIRVSFSGFPATFAVLLHFVTVTLV